MAGDAPKIGIAYIEVKARRATDFERDAREMGKEAGKEYERAFAKEAGKDPAGGKAKRAAQGKKIGDEIGTPAGKAAAEKTSKGLTEGLAKSRTQREKDGDEFGRILGASAGKRATKEISGLIRRNRRTFQTEGEAAGAAFGNGASATLRSRLQLGLGITGAILRNRMKTIGQGVGVVLGENVAARFGSGLLSAASKVGGQAKKILENDIYQGINKGLRRALLGSAAVGLVASSLSGLSSVIVGTVGAATDLSGAFGILPGLLLAVGVAAATVKVGFHGVGDAIKDAFGTAKDYNKAAAKLSPEAKRFTDAIRGMKKELKGVQQSTQQGLFRGSGKEVRELGERYLPLIKRGLTETAQAFGRGRRSVAEYLNTAGATNRVTEILGDTSLAAGRLSRSFKPVVQSLLNIGSVGTSFLPDLADKLSTVAERFARFTVSARQDGSLAQFFQEGIDSVGDLGNALKGAGRILGAFFAAGNAADSSPLETFAGVLNSIADTVNKPAFQAGLSNFFDAVGVAGERLGEKIGVLGDALVTLEPSISRLVETGAVALPSILESVAGAAESLAPALNVLTTAFAAVAPAAGPILLALVGVKVGLLAVAGVAKVVGVITAVRGAILTMGTTAVATRIRLLGVAASLQAVGLSSAAARVQFLATTSALKLLGAAAGLVAVGFAAVKISEYVGGAAVAKVSTDKLAESFRSLGRGQDLGGEALKLFSDGMGPFRKDAEDGAQALDRFGISAFNALDKGWDARLRRFQEMGAVQARFKEQAASVDAALTKLAQNGGLEEAGRSYSEFLKAATDEGVPLSVIQKQFPKFNAAVAASGKSIDGTTGKVKDLTLSIESLISASDEYANKQLDANNSARGYQSALLAVRDAAKEGGKGIDITTAAGFRNSEALDTLAQRGIDLAKATAGDGPAAQAKFRESLLQTRSDLVKAGIRLGLTRKAARDYADSLLQIPSRKSTRFSTPGMTAASALAAEYARTLKRLPTNKVVTVTTRFFQVGKEPGSFGNGLGVYRAAGGFVEPLRRAPGGLVDPRLGAPRQDNVPLLVSGGEFVMNAFATAQPGVLALLRKINAENRYPQKLANGGQVRAAAGLNDITASAPARMTRIENIAAAPAPSAPVGDMANAIAEAVAAAVAREIRGLRVVMQDGVLAGSVSREMGRSF
jgi:hypothetical protein